jgi:lipid A disaccharide synthetase
MLDILILSNAPGEVTTWVRPVVAALRQRFSTNEARISVVLSPCPNAGGREAEIALAYPEVDRAQSAQHFWNFLFWGKTAANWDWHPQGIVIFLGGDQVFPLAIGRRLGYKTLIYAEWEARWLPWIDQFAVMNDSARKKVSAKYLAKVSVVGDLMVEAGAQRRATSRSNLIGLLPGSKSQKLQMGLPFMLAIAELLQEAQPELEFVIPVAPSVTVEYIAQFGDLQYNPVIELVGGTTAKLYEGDRSYLETAKGVKVWLHTDFPAYEQLSECCLCLTTIGANTAELAALGIPMIVLLPTYQLDAMRSWDGIPGILARLPIIGSPIAKGINWLAFKQLNGRKLAWPNIWAGKEIVPELVGRITTQEVANLALDYLEHPEKLAEIGINLSLVRGEPGAALKIADIVQELFAIPGSQTNNF